MSASDELKRAMRDRVRAARIRLSPTVRAAASESIARRALELPEVSRARSVLAYAALPEEVDPASLVEALRALCARVALPRVCGPGVLSLHWVEPGESLLRGALGIDEPAAECPTASPADFDLVIVPGVAFDASCGRLGFGGGFYDVLLPTLPPSAFALGVAFDEQTVDAIPCEAHDAAVDAVVTPTSLLRRRQ